MTGVHSTPRLKTGWAVRKTGAKRALRLHKTEAEAWAEAKDIARRDGVTAYRHGRDGRIADRVPA